MFAGFSLLRLGSFGSSHDSRLRDPYCRAAKFDMDIYFVYLKYDTHDFGSR